MLPQVKLAIGGVICAAATVYLAYLGAAQSWRYYVLVDECAASGDSLVGRRLRVSGRVAEGSLHIRSDRSLATFALAGQCARVTTTCAGPLPDNLAEEMDVVVEGTLQPDGVLHGDKVLTRCASKYQADAQNAASR